MLSLCRTCLHVINVNALVLKLIKIGFAALRAEHRWSEASQLFLRPITQSMIKLIPPTRQRTRKPTSAVRRGIVRRPSARTEIIVSLKRD